MSYRTLEIWKLARRATIEIHQMALTKLPKFEMFAEGAQIRRSVKSVRSNIVEGYGRRRYKQEFIKFLVYAQGSCDETMDHLETLFETGSLGAHPGTVPERGSVTRSNVSRPKPPAPRQLPYRAVLGPRAVPRPQRIAKPAEVGTFRPPPKPNVSRAVARCARSLADEKLFGDIRTVMDELGRKLNIFLQSVEAGHRSEK